MQLQKGQKIKLEETLVNSKLKLDIQQDAKFLMDISCFGLDENEKLSNESYMIFYNQLTSPENAINLIHNGKGSQFELQLDKIPNFITKLIFTATIDSEVIETMKDIIFINFKLGEYELILTGQDFNKEKAIMIAEIYRKEGVWRLGVNGQGFNGGLDALLVHFGGQVAEAVSTPPALIDVAPVPIAKISLEKKFENKAPQLVSLAKKAAISLEKNKLSDVKARLAFILDASGSMIGQYNSNQVQETLNRVFPLGVHFDDDEQLETWAFADRSKKLTDISFDNYVDYVKQDNGGWRKWMSDLNSSYNNEPVVIREVIKYFTGLDAPSLASITKTEKTGFLGFGSKTTMKEEFAPKLDAQLPIFILFISDGGVAYNEDIEFLIKWSSTLPIFWQFIGIGGCNYGALEKLDNMTDRFVDNANFFSINNLAQLTEDELYDKMMGEFPKWLVESRNKGLIT